MKQSFPAFSFKIFPNFMIYLETFVRRLSWVILFYDYPRCQRQPDMESFAPRWRFGSECNTLVPFGAAGCRVSNVNFSNL